MENSHIAECFAQFVHSGWRSSHFHRKSGGGELADRFEVGEGKGVGVGVEGLGEGETCR